MDEWKAKAIWRTRRNHIIRWIPIEIAIMAGLCYLAIRLEMPGASWERIKENIWIFVFLYLIGLWILVAASVSRAENGSLIADFARNKWQIRHRSNPRNYYTDHHIADRQYNLNNAYDSTMLGVDTVMSGLSFAWLLITMIPNMILWIACQIKNLICYEIVAIPFPITTLYWYIESRNKKDVLTIGLGIVGFVGYFACMIIAAMKI